ncbi:sorting nexin-22 isoform X2 [Poecile atricapillus]|uniref:sorting nexin-22 isoform X2 n=1 Tax=Poecile atricapillus TaxID=48891 RepID=UPI0027391AEB|nr:sorting nexin-22 isoform X2 [Poecile atricapillus]
MWDMGKGILVMSLCTQDRDRHIPSPRSAGSKCPRGFPARALFTPGMATPGPRVLVFRVEVLCNGRRHTVTKRYSEFQALHKRIKKTCKVPDFPPRHVPNWMPKVLEQRRQGLELYLQGVLYHNEELPQDVLDFLKVRRCQQNPKASSPPTRLLPSQRPVVGFCSDPYVRPHGTDLLPNTVLSGVLQGLYLPLSCVPGQAAPRASGMMSSQTPTQHPGMQW